MHWLLSMVCDSKYGKECWLEEQLPPLLFLDKLSVGFLVKCDRLLLERCTVRHVIDTER